MHIQPIIEAFGTTWNLSSLFAIFISMIIVVIIAIAGTRNLSVNKPGKMQNFLEWLVEFIQNLIGSTMDAKRGAKYMMLGLTLIMYIFVANLLGLPFNIITEHEEPFSFAGTTIIDEEAIHHAEETNHHLEIAWWKSPTADMSAAMGLALMVVLLSHYIGLRSSVKGYFKHYATPHWLFTPLEIINEIAKLLTLGLRLFGNIFAGEVLIAVILMMPVFIGVLAPGIIPMVIWQGFSLFVGVIQAFVFTMLTMVYISQKQSVGDHH